MGVTFCDTTFAMPQPTQPNSSTQASWVAPCPMTHARAEGMQIKPNFQAKRLSWGRVLLKTIVFLQQSARSLVQRHQPVYRLSIACLLHLSKTLSICLARAQGWVPWGEFGRDQGIALHETVANVLQLKMALFWGDRSRAGHNLFA